MQIMPSGGGWTNPAALTQQALGDSKHSSTIKNTATAAEPVTALEQTNKTSDRDAQERYDGPQPGNATGASGDATKPAGEVHDSMMALPADDDLGAATLDLLG